MRIQLILLFIKLILYSSLANVSRYSISYNVMSPIPLEFGLNWTSWQSYSAAGEAMYIRNMTNNIPILSILISKLGNISKYIV